MSCTKLEDTELCLSSGDKWTDSLNDISYMVSKIGLEQNCKDGPRFIPLDGIKDNDGNNIYKIIYKEEIGMGNLGAIKREIDEIIEDIGNVTQSLNPNPSIIKVKNPNTEQCVSVYAYDYQNNNSEIALCNTENFSNFKKYDNDKINKKNIYKLYLLAIGSLITFLIYKLFQKK